MVFSGLASAQVSCSALTPVAPSFIRAEGQTELLPTINLTCTNATAAVATLTATVYVTPAVTITSSLLAGSSTNTEGVASIGGVASGTATINGSSIIFNSIAVPAVAGAFTVTLNNIRINATAIPSTAGAAPTAVTAQAFVSGVNVTPGSTGTASSVAFVTNGLLASNFYSDVARANKSKTNVPGANSGSPFGVCGSINNSGSTNPTPSFFIAVDEGFQQAFKTNADESSRVAPEGATANTGTRIQINLTNIPSGLAIFAPVNVAATSAGVLSAGGSTLIAQISATASTNGTANVQTAVTSPAQFVSPTVLVQPVGASGGVFSVPVSNGSATIIYEVATDGGLGTLDSFTIPVYLQSGTNAVAIQTASLSASVSFAPIAAATVVPSFAVGSSTNTLSVLGFAQCQTTLLFPFVTNAAGFETGIAISNTSKDPFGAAKPQSGTCTLSFYGTGGTNPTAVVAPNSNEGAGQPYAAGEAYAFTLTQALAVNAANPATFQGYIIASCNFNYAHGFGYITYGFPGTSSDTMGYLALTTGRGATGAVADSTGN
jgi:hypothetical protein